MVKPTILDSRGNPIRTSPASPPRVPIRARYDAAQTTDENRRWWAQADNLSARAANDPVTRLKLRTRARYEVANNSWAHGIADSLADYMVGDGPMLQMLTEDALLNRRVEADYSRWSAAARIAEKLWVMQRAKIVDGENFGLLTNNPGLPGRVQLDLALIESDQVATPYPALGPLAVDGIQLDTHGNPVEYHLLRSHPGDGLAYNLGGQFDRVDARNVIHWFKPDRPGQYRGIPELTPALELFAQLRRYRMAVLAAAETAADFAALLESELPPAGDDEDDESINAFSSTEIERRMMTTLPKGYKLAQLRAEQPTTTYEMFVRQLLTEIARCLCVPYAIAAGDYSNHNYSSGRLDNQSFHRGLAVERSRLELGVLDRIFAAWLAEMTALGQVPADLDRWPHRWLWPGMEHVDPEKEANATTARLQNYTTTYSDECQKQGVDPESRAQQIARDVALFEGLGLRHPYQAGSPAGSPSTPGASNEQPPQAAARGHRFDLEARDRRNGHA